MAEITPPTIWDFSTTTSGANSSGAGQPSAPLGLVEGSRPTLVQAPQPDPTSSLHPWNQASSYRHSISYPGHLDHAPEGAPIILYSAPSMLTSGLAHVIDNRSMEMQSTDISGDPTWPTVESPLEERNVAIPTAATNPTANHELYRIYSNHQQSESTLNAHISHQSWLQNSAGAFPMTLPPTSSSGLHSHQRLVQPHNNFEPHPIGSGKGYQSRYAFASSMTAVGTPSPEHSSWSETPKGAENGYHPSISYRLPHVQPIASQNIPDLQQLHATSHEPPVSSQRTPAPVLLPRSSSLQHNSLAMSRPVGVAPRPTLAIRRRATIAGTAASSAVGVMTGTKRKPLPKIYGCAYESCGKKFDRPSTLKVHEAIHTGAKDHLCEYCRRAFTVQSNMKRHMRVCKHKPLSPPLSYCYFVCIPPGLPLIRPSFLSLGSQHPPTVKSSGSSSSPPSSSSMSASNSRLLPAPESQAMVRSVPTMSASSAAHLVNTVEPGSGLPFEIQSRASASIQGGNTLNRDNMNLSSYGSVDAVTGSPPEVVRGAKAPMVIAAMFSMQQNVPSSLAKFTLVQLECDAPVRPVRPHPKYTFLYRERDALAAAESMTSGSSAYISPVPDVVPGQTSSDAPIPGSGMTAMFVPGSTDTGEVDGQGDEKKKQEGGEDGEVAVVVAIDRSIRTQRLLPLPTDLFEERDSYYPRSRYCYHPAEYDSIMILPGPGIADLPIDDELGQTA